MKKVVLTLCFVGGSVALMMAQDQDTTTNNQYNSDQYRTDQPSQYPQDAQSQDMQGQDQQQFGDRVQPTELPEEVKTALEGEDFRGWLISGAFKADRSAAESDSTNSAPQNQAFGTEDEEIYIIELKNGAETKMVAFDKSGQEVELESIEGQGLNDGSNQYNQNGQYNQDQNTQQESDQYNQNGQMNETTPDQTSPHQTPRDETTPDQSTPDQSTFDQPGQLDGKQSTETPGDHSSTNDATSDRP